MTLVVTVQCGGSKPVGERPASAELEIAPAQVDDDLGRDLDRVDAQMIERRVAGEAGHAALVAGLALVAVGDPHRGRLADHAAERQRRQAPAPDARAAAARPCSRPPRRSSARGGPAPQPALQQLRHQRQHGRDEALHVGGAAAVQAAVARGARRTDRSTSPGRRPARRRCGRTARGRRARAARSWPADWPCAPVSSNTSVRGDAQPVEVVAHELDQREIGVAAGGVETDQPRQQLGTVRRLARVTGVLMMVDVAPAGPADYRPRPRGLSCPRRSQSNGRRGRCAGRARRRRTILSLAGAAAGCGGLAARRAAGATDDDPEQSPTVRARAAGGAWLRLVCSGLGWALAGRARADAQTRRQRPAGRAWSRSARRSASDGRTADTLGTEREGSGVVIDDDGLILTIGYLILEAIEVNVAGAGPDPVAAEIVAYDHESGFGLLRAREPLDVAPLALGDSAALRPRQPLAGGEPDRRARRRRGLRGRPAGVRRLLGIPARGRDLHRAAARRLRRRRADRRGRAPGRDRLAGGQRCRPARAARCPATCSCRSTSSSRSWPTCSPAAGAAIRRGPGSA